MHHHQNPTESQNELSYTRDFSLFMLQPTYLSVIQVPAQIAGLATGAPGDVIQVQLDCLGVTCIIIAHVCNCMYCDVCIVKCHYGELNVLPEIYVC